MIYASVILTSFCVAQYQVEHEDYAKSAISTLDAHTGQNVLSARFHPDPSLDLLASGSTDRTVVVTNWKTGQKLATAHGAHSGPVLTLDWHPTVEGRLVTGSLDNSAAVIQISGLSGPLEEIRYDILSQHKVHRKHVVRVKWSPDGKRFATASYDHYLKIFEEQPADAEGERYIEIKSFELSEAVECVTWTPDGKWLIASVRVDNYLHYYDTESWLETKFNMNLNPLDDHVSFTAMDLSLSKDGKKLLVSTDKSRVIMFSTATPLQIRNFYDIPNGEWSTPRAVWNQSGGFIYVSSEDKSIYVFDAVTGAKVTTLPGHSSNIRDLCSHPTLDTIASASFDKTIKIWQ